MKGRLSSSKQMETDKVSDAANEESRPSGAYTRSLVKHLTSKDSLDGNVENLTQNGECYSDDKNGKQQQQQQEQQPQQQPQHKKQVRRRLHTSRPYQERLLNMAEARREIVTALKFHRASMKQQESVANNLDHRSLHEKKQKSNTTHNFYPSTATITTTATAVANPYSTLSRPPPPTPYWPISTIAPPPPLSSYHDNQDFVLPNQTLGLNLNFQNFSNLDTKLYHKPMWMHSASSSTPSSSLVPGGEKPKEALSNSSGGLRHHAMDDDEMEEIRSLGEQHQTEWNDTVNLVASARWCNFLKTMEIEADECNGFDQVMKFPTWLINSSETSCLEQSFDDRFSDAYFQDPVLPCMDIGEIEAMDGEWLA